MCKSEGIRATEYVILRCGTEVIFALNLVVSQPEDCSDYQF